MEEKINEELEQAYDELDKIQRVQEQVDILNKGLNSCVDIVNSSISNNKITEQLNQLETDNLKAYKSVKNNIEEQYIDTKDKIYRMQEEKKSLEEQKKEKNEEEKEEK